MRDPPRAGSTMGSGALRLRFGVRDVLRLAARARAGDKRE